MPTADILVCRGAVLVSLLAAVTLGSAVAQQEHSERLNGSPSSLVTSKVQPLGLSPASEADSCWVLGTSPGLQVTVRGLLDAKVASSSYNEDPGLLFDGYWCVFTVTAWQTLLCQWRTTTVYSTHIGLYYIQALCKYITKITKPHPAEALHATTQLCCSS